LLGGIQFATAELPLLELMDCGMTIWDPNSQNPIPDVSNGWELRNTTNHLIYQKLIIKHGRLKKLSLWGCSGLDVRLFKLITLVYVCIVFSWPLSVQI
jgi:hypothetical protein